MSWWFVSAPRRSLGATGGVWLRWPAWTQLGRSRQAWALVPLGQRAPSSQPDSVCHAGPPPWHREGLAGHVPRAHRQRSRGMPSGQRSPMPPVAPRLRLGAETNHQDTALHPRSRVIVSSLRLARPTRPLRHQPRRSRAAEPNPQTQETPGTLGARGRSSAHRAPSPAKRGEGPCLPGPPRRFSPEAQRRGKSGVGIKAPGQFFRNARWPSCARWRPGRQPAGRRGPAAGAARRVPGRATGRRASCGRSRGSRRRCGCGR